MADYRAILGTVYRGESQLKNMSSKQWIVNRILGEAHITIAVISMTCILNSSQLVGSQRNFEVVLCNQAISLLQPTYLVPKRVVSQMLHCVIKQITLNLPDADRKQQAGCPLEPVLHCFNSTSVVSLPPGQHGVNSSIGFSGSLLALYPGPFHATEREKKKGLVSTACTCINY